MGFLGSWERLKSVPIIHNQNTKWNITRSLIWVNGRLNVKLMDNSFKQQDIYSTVEPCSKYARTYPNHLQYTQHKVEYPGALLLYYRLLVKLNWLRITNALTYTVPELYVIFTCITVIWGNFGHFSWENQLHVIQVFGVVYFCKL